MAKLAQITKGIFSFFKNYSFTLACIILFCAISWKFEFFVYQKRPFTLSAISLVFVMHLFSRIKYNIIPTILLSIIVTLNFYCAYSLNTYLNAGLFGSIMDTNPNEAASMAKDIWALAVPMFVFSLFLISMSVRELKKSPIPLKVSIIGLSIYVLLIFPYYMYSFIDQRHGIGPRQKENVLIYTEIASQRTAPILYGNIVTAINYSVERIKYRNFYNNENKTLTKGITYPQDSIENLLPEKIYLIIGESATRHHLSAYGYYQPTTPYLDSIAKNDSTVTLYNGYSSATITRDAFRQFLTSSSPHNMDAFLDTKSLIDMANDIGYETVWLSPFSGMFRQHDGTFLQLLASGAQKYKYISTRDDLEYIPVVKDLIIPNKKQLILMGLNGSHGAYKDGYDSIDAAHLPYNEELSQDVNDYNRTIHHTDRLIKEAHELMGEDQDAVLIYFSDHGEVVGKGHGMSYGRNQIEIPLFTINKSSIDLDNLVKKYTYQQENKEAVNSLAFFYIISELLGYQVSQEGIEHAIEESKYVYFSDRTVQLASEMKDNN